MLALGLESWGAGQGALGAVLQAPLKLPPGQATSSVWASQGLPKRTVPGSLVSAFGLGFISL